MPKYCFRMTNISKYYDLCLFKVSLCEENYQSSKIDLEDIIMSILTLRKFTFEDDLKQLLDEMISKCPMEMVNRLHPYSNKD